MDGLLLGLAGLHSAGDAGEQPAKVHGCGELASTIGGHVLGLSDDEFRESVATGTPGRAACGNSARRDLCGAVRSGHTYVSKAPALR
jgi:hypothetical protein